MRSACWFTNRVFSNQSPLKKDLHTIMLTGHRLHYCTPDQKVFDFSFKISELQINQHPALKSKFNAVPAYSWNIISGIPITASIIIHQNNTPLSHNTFLYKKKNICFNSRLLSAKLRFPERNYASVKNAYFWYQMSVSLQNTLKIDEPIRVMCTIRWLMRRTLF